MRTILIAATLAAIAGPALAAHDIQTIARPYESGLQLSATKSCQALTEKTAQTGDQPLARRLDQLPPALLEHAVVRSVKGCIVREVVYQGRTVWVQPSVPTIQPLAPAQH